MNKDNYLVVVAHPDDEVLGAGGTIFKLIQDGLKVSVCILCADVYARHLRPDDDQLRADMLKSFQVLGIKNYYLGKFPNLKLNTVEHIEIVAFIEKAIEDSNCNIIITHHPADLNNDHNFVSIACQEASKLFQRRDNIRDLKELLFMEVLSSTEWALNSSLTPFFANYFIEIGKEGLNKKIEALKAYKNVMRKFPHPRCDEALESLATLRAVQSGLDYAEAFQCVFRRKKTNE